MRLVTPLPRAAAAAGLALVLGAGLSACSDDSTPSPAPEQPSTSAAAPPPSLADLDTATLVVPRTGFCAEVPEEAVTAALGTEAVESDAYGNGEQAELTGDLTDVAHEWSCRWRSEERGTARVWVFAPPVTVERAGELADALAARADDSSCRTLRQPSFGDPGAAVLCRTGPTRQLLRVGLFGDAWVTCQLTLARDVAGGELVERSDAWCAAVLETARASVATEA